MKIIWDVNDSDIKKVVDFVNNNKTLLVEKRMLKNIRRKELVISKDIILKKMLRCLLTGQQDINQDKKLNAFFNKTPFLFTDEFLSKEYDIESAVQEALASNGIIPSGKTINFFILNYFYLLQSNWEIMVELEKCSAEDYTVAQERELADYIDKVFKGFGSIQARSFLQTLGLTKYEIPITPQFIGWLKNFGFPILFSPIALQDKSFYHFISNGIQLLCEKANIYPCLLDATVFSSKDTKAWKSSIIKGRGE
ncbi:hypothetical protein BZG02_10385 [Labilibaculum filiforme]|uniref:Uncharacterized protein n=1 Tax=Labilibaculum filiforme TaxID=1940526 RepID=A0A2N3HYM1_9BACT|nr:hypothetical protein [Labilibaculum filiforme]PKQ63159.1 hypothetical protein BZG02_10385 [Labilibaculum filiforme]